MGDIDLNLILVRHTSIGIYNVNINIQYVLTMWCYNGQGYMTNFSTDSII